MEVKESSKREAWRDIVSILALFYLQPIGVIVMWFIARWSIATKWVATIFIGFIPLGILAYTATQDYKFTETQRAYAPIAGLQQALDFYAIETGKYPATLEGLPAEYDGFVGDIPLENELVYTPTEDGASYTIKAKVLDKEIELRPPLSEIPSTE